jgi:hypothetical protein
MMNKILELVVFSQDLLVTQYEKAIINRYHFLEYFLSNL